MRVLLDTNILLDLILARAPFASGAALLWEAQRDGRFDGYVSPISLINVFYIARKNKGIDEAREAVRMILAGFDVCALEMAAMHVALALPLNDYEDAVQVASALACGLDAIITRDAKDFKDASLPVFSPPDFLAHLSADDQASV